MIKAVVFDYGKVISHAPNTHTRQDIADAYGVAEEDIGKLLGKYIGDFRKGNITEDEFWEKLSFDLNKPIPENKYDLWRKDFAKKLEISEEILNFVRQLKANGIKVAVLSNNIAPYVEIIKNRGGYKDFELVINSCEVGFSKPEKEIYELALAKLNLQPNEVLFVDDRQENLDTAKSLGLETELVTDISKLKQDILQKLQSSI